MRSIQAGIHGRVARRNSKDSVCHYQTAAAVQLQGWIAAWLARGLVLRTQRDRANAAAARITGTLCRCDVAYEVGLRRRIAEAEAENHIQASLCTG